MTSDHQVSEIAIDTDRGRFVALASGDASRPLVLVLHGFPDAPPTFEPLLEELRGRGYHVVAPWMRGYRPSPVEGPYDIETLAEDVGALLAALSPDAPAHLLGHDWGAVATYAASVSHRQRIASAVTLAVPHPLAFLAELDGAQLVRSWYMMFFQLPGAARLARAKDFGLIDRLWRQWSPGYELPAELRRELHEYLAASWPAPLHYYRALLRPPGAALARVGPRSPARQRVTVPTLYLHGSDDGCIGAEQGRSAERCFAGRYRREILSGAGHFLAAERPREVAALAGEWFAGTMADT